jgi:hypothetical protein
LSEPRRVFAEIAGRLPQKKLTKVQPKRIINSLLDEFRQLLTKAEPCCPPLAEVPKAEVVNALNNNISHIPPPTPSSNAIKLRDLLGVWSPFSPSGRDAEGREGIRLC